MSMFGFTITEDYRKWPFSRYKSEDRFDCYMNL